MSDRYAFLRTAERSGEIIAFIADKDILGESGVEDLRKAFNAHAAPHIRSGVLTLTGVEIRKLRDHLIDHAKQTGESMPNSLAALDRASECIERRRAAAPH